MIVLGLSAFLDDPAAALLVNGRIVALCEEERLSRAKRGVTRLAHASATTPERMTPVGPHELRHFPLASAEACLSLGGLAWEDVDVICLAFDLPGALERPAEYAAGFPRLPPAVAGARLDAFRAYVAYLRRLADRAGACLEFVRHHDAHAAGAAFASPFRRCNVLTMDGMGEWESTTLTHFDGSAFEQLAVARLPHSMGRIYSSLTQYLGFRSNEEEEKVMALAAYGEDCWSHVFSRLVRLREDGYEVDAEAVWTAESGHGFTHPSPLPSLFGRPRRGRHEAPLEAPWPDIARSLQEALFRVSRHLVAMAAARTGPQPLAMSGGVALNCENNGRLLREVGLVEALFVQPQANDAGAALGAAYRVHFARTGSRPESMRRVDLGRGWSDETLGSLLKDCGLPHEAPSDLAAAAADEIAAGRVVGWFQGRSEAGPRALGNRSILALPTSAAMARRVNDRVKSREPWRPFGASLPAERSERVLAARGDLRFMTIAVPLTEEGRGAFPAAAHVNGTTRPQTVERQTLPLYHALLEEVRLRTGAPGVLNTSFNVAGEPIVDHPREALADFATTGMDALVLGPYLVRKDAWRGAA